MAVPSFERRKPARRPLAEHLPRERIDLCATCDLPMHASGLGIV
ncbi:MULTISPECIES: transposase [Bradyrhizobium]|nr:transposase [Bradyrhizobium zhengyangense]MCG2673165.1 transposase [Bradyrhizobium zhengyangense]